MPSLDKLKGRALIIIAAVLVGSILVTFFAYHIASTSVDCSRNTHRSNHGCSRYKPYSSYTCVTDADTDDITYIKSWINTRCKR